MNFIMLGWHGKRRFLIYISPTLRIDNPLLKPLQDKQPRIYKFFWEEIRFFENTLN